MRDLDDKISALERTLEQDFGEEEEYAPMRGQCFEVSDLVGFPYKFEIFTLKMLFFKQFSQEYTYKLCPFDYAEQKPKHGGAGTRYAGNKVSENKNYYNIFKKIIFQAGKLGGVGAGRRAPRRHELHQGGPVLERAGEV